MIDGRRRGELTPRLRLDAALLIENEEAEKGAEVGRVDVLFGRHLVQLVAKEAHRRLVFGQEAGVELKLADFQTRRTTLDHAAQRVARVVRDHRDVTANGHIQR